MRSIRASGVTSSMEQETAAVPATARKEAAPATAAILEEGPAAAVAHLVSPNEFILRVMAS